MAKKTALDKAIEQLDSEIAVLQAARARLVQQQGKTSTKRANVRLAVAPPAKEGA